MKTEQLEYGDIVKMPNTVFTIQWQQFDNLIKLLSNSKIIFYDASKQLYVIDGIPITNTFLNEVSSKASHIINVIANMQLRDKIIIDLDQLKK